jgi:hypothetical protein
MFSSYPLLLLLFFNHNKNILESFSAYFFDWCWQIYNWNYQKHFTGECHLVWIDMKNDSSFVKHDLKRMLKYKWWVRLSVSIAFTLTVFSLSPTRRCPLLLFNVECVILDSIEYISVKLLINSSFIYYLTHCKVDKTIQSCDQLWFGRVLVVSLRSSDG